MLKVLTPLFLNEIYFKVLQLNLYMIVGNLHINQGVESKRNFSNHMKFMVGGHSQNRWTMTSKFWIRDLALMELLQDGQPATNATMPHWGMNSPPIEISLQKLVYSRDLRWCDSVDVKYFNPTYMILSLHICCMGRAINLQQKCPNPWWFGVPREYPPTALEWCVHITLDEIELSNSVKLSLDWQRYSDLQKDQWRKSLLSIGQP